MSGAFIVLKTGVFGWAFWLYLSLLAFILWILSKVGFKVNNAIGKARNLKSEFDEFRASKAKQGKS